MLQTIQMSIMEIEEMFRRIVCRILRLNEEDSGGRVRFVWGSNIDAMSMSAPNAGTDEDICYIQITPQEDAYNRQREIRYVDEDERDLTVLDEHTDVHQVLFINYGKNAYECARAIRNGLHHDRIRRMLRFNNFALVPDVPAPRRVPELVNANWVNRVDVSAVFNQFVRLVGAMGGPTDNSEGGPGDPGDPGGPGGTPSPDVTMRVIESVGVTIAQENGTKTKLETNGKE